LVTGLLLTKGKIPTILAGILVICGLNSVILFVMKSPKKSLLNQPKIQDVLQTMALPDYYDTMLLRISVLVVLMILQKFFFN
ncbi:ABC transporter permease, partial [Enterococcus faecalis]